MKSHRWSVVPFLLLLVPTFLAAQISVRSPKPPSTELRTAVDTLHGVVIEDPYRWLEDQDSPETRRWIEAQSAFTDSLLAQVPGREAIRGRLGELLKVDFVGTPIERGGRFFFSKRAKDADLPVICMRQGIDGTDEVLLDPHPLSADHRTSIGLMNITSDGSMLAYAIRKGGEDEVEVRLYDVGARADLSKRFGRARYLGFSILPDKSGIYYGLQTREGPRLYYHSMATGRDSLVLGEGLHSGKWIGSSLSDDGRSLVITTGEGSAPKKTEIVVMDLAPGGSARTVVDDIDARFSAAVAGQSLLIQTNWEAPNGRILRAPLSNPSREHWTEIVPQSSGVILGFSVAGGKLFVSTLDSVRSRVVQFDLDGKRERELSFPAIGTVSGVQGKWDSDRAFFSFSSYHIPPTTYLLDVASGATREWSRLNVPIQSEAFEVKQVWYPSRDGTKVPMFLLTRRGLSLDGTNPVYLTGYGGFAASQTPGYSATAVALAERGFVYAVANLRGGSEFGEGWHQAGMLGSKQNVFDDFIGAAEYLIASGYTRPSRLAIAGGSNGGLLVGAAMTQRPDLFGAVVCSYPLLDMIRYHLFLVARYWVPEYGSSDDPAQFAVLLAYSPYQRVKDGTPYPPVLFVTGDADTRVAPLHARKMAARVQAASSSGRPVLLKYDTRSGHSGGAPVTKQIDDATDILAFLFWQLEVQ